MVTSVETFFDAVRTSGLLPPDELETLVAGLPPEARPQEASEVARLLVERKKLTRYQADQLLEGRTRLVLGKYVILDELGAGGMGLVFKAHHRRMKRVVALKVLPPEVVSVVSRLQRFHREVEAAARLNHPNIVTAYDADEADGIHFLVMEFVDGCDLSRYVRTHGRLSQRKAVEYVLQAARGLQYAHQKGVVHRDIKPANLLVDGEGVVRVLDMGLARLESSDDSSQPASHEDLTSTGRVMGTVDYMAPEQAIDSKHIDRRSDIYSLGCTLFFLLVGRPPTPEGSLTEKLLWHQNGPAPSLRLYRPDVIAELEAVFQRMMVRHPDDRYQTMSEVIAELERCLERIEALRESTLPLGVPPAVAAGSGAASQSVVLAEVVEPRIRGADTRPIPHAADRTMIESAPPRRPSAARRHERQMPFVMGGVCGVGLLLALFLWVLAVYEPSGSGEVWDEEVRKLVDRVLLTGVDGQAGRQIYSDITTALEAGKEGEWKIGAGLTRDKQAYHIQVVKGEVRSRALTAEEAAGAGLAPQQTSKTVDSSLQMRSHSLVALENAQLALASGANGSRITGRVFCTFTGEDQPVEDVALVVRVRQQQGRLNRTREMYQHLSWKKLESTWVDVDVELDDDLVAPDLLVELSMQAFLFRPKASFYRVSNDLVSPVAME